MCWTSDFASGSEITNKKTTIWKKIVEEYLAKIKHYLGLENKHAGIITSHVSPSCFVIHKSQALEDRCPPHWRGDHRLGETRMKCTQNTYLMSLVKWGDGLKTMYTYFVAKWGGRYWNISGRYCCKVGIELKIWIFDCYGKTPCSKDKIAIFDVNMIYCDAFGKQLGWY